VRCPEPEHPEPRDAMRPAVRLQLACAAVAAIAACRPARGTLESAAAFPVVAPVSAAGTYQLAVCRGPACVPRDSTTGYVLATLVLLDSAGAVAADMPPAQWEPSRLATGCMVVRHRRNVGNSYAGISVREYFVWRDSAGQVYFPLFRSPDAGYSVSARMTATGLAGRGGSWGAGAAEIHGPPDTVVAVRTGPPDRLRCHVPDPREKR
jgi:hypothetical protein